MYSIYSRPIIIWRVTAVSPSLYKKGMEPVGFLAGKLEEGSITIFMPLENTHKLSL